MLTAIHPKLPMRNKSATKDYYIGKLGFRQLGDYDGYLIVGIDNIEIHFFEFKELNPEENYGQVYIRVKDIEIFYGSILEREIEVHPNGPLQIKPWGRKEFALLDPDNNLLTFGERV